MMNNKKGLSDVVTTVLIILLVLAAVVIIWSFVRPAIEKPLQTLTGACTELDVKVTNCSVGTNSPTSYNVTVKVTRGADNANLKNVALSIGLADSSTTVNSTLGALEALGSKSYTLTGITSKPVDAIATGQILAESGEPKLCPPVSTKFSCS